MVARQSQVDEAQEVAVVLEIEEEMARTGLCFHQWTHTIDVRMRLSRAQKELAVDRNWLREIDVHLISVDRLGPVV